MIDVALFLILRDVCYLRWLLVSDARILESHAELLQVKCIMKRCRINASKFCEWWPCEFDLYMYCLMYINNNNNK